jgi:aminopeptidase N
MRTSFWLILLCLASVVLGQDVYEDLIKSEREAYLNKKQVKTKRSGKQYDLTYQNLKLTVDPAVRNISGSVYAELLAEEDGFNLVSFDLDSRMQVDSVYVNGALASFQHINDEVLITTPTAPQGSAFSTEVFYRGNPSINEQKGFSYDFQRDGPIAWTLSQPYGAYGWWPCKQQLADKIDSFDMEITIPVGNKSSGLGLLKAVDTLDENWVRYKWEHRYPVSTYLVAVAVSNYYEDSHYIHFPDGDSLLHVDYLYPAYKPAADTLRRNIDPMMLLFDSLFGQYPYMNEKYGHAQFGRGGGMEHQTMSFMSDLNFDLMAHELAHMWFGNKLTCGSWQDLWLNEGFATYLNAIAREHIRGRNSFVEFMDASRTRVISEPDGSVYAYDTTVVAELFSGQLRYRKAAWVLHMLRWELGDDVFYKALKDYVTDDNLLQEGFARTNQFQALVEASSGVKLDTFFNQWVYNEGHPVVVVDWSRNGDEVEVSLSQDPSHESVEVFNLKLELLLRGEDRDSLITIRFDKLKQVFAINPGFKVVEVVADPHTWLLMQFTVVEGSHQNYNLVNIFPNPSGNTFYIYLKDRKVDAVEVTNGLGQLIMQQSVSDLRNQLITVNLSNQPSGLYYVKSISGDESVVQKVVKAPTD